MPHRQLWLDHLLALRMLEVDAPGREEGLFVFLHPAGNVACSRAAARYQELLVDSETFQPLTLERFLHALGSASGEQWTAELVDRYVGGTGVLQP